MLERLEPDASIAKTLSANDLGLTGSHQAGILIPKLPDILGFFPALCTKAKNPRAEIRLEDKSGQRWKFVFVYYNNRLFGGTRNEYRLTGMTAFLRVHNLQPGDTLVFTRKGARYTVGFERARGKNGESKTVITLSNSWKIVKL